MCSCLLPPAQGGLEAAASNFLSPGDHVVVCTAGKFGERFVEIAKAWGLKSTVLKAEYGDVVSPADLARTLEANPDVKAVMVQASETSTGAMHDIKAMAAAVKKTKCPDDR
jgi:aspartate aminotransferase-like enzyme